MQERHKQKLVVLSLGLALVFNIPIVLIFANDWTLNGFPAFYVFTFGVWLISVIISSYVLLKYYD